MNDSRTPLPYKIYLLAGIALNALLTVFIIISFFEYNASDTDPFSDSMFLIGYALCFTYFVSVLGHRSFLRNYSYKGTWMELFALSIVSFSMSAYLLNESIHLFSPFVLWAKVVIVMLHAALIYIAFQHRMPTWLNTVFSFLLGITFVFSIYQSIYLAPGYGIGVVGTMLLGIGLHIFVPLIIIVFLIIYYIKRLHRVKVLRYSFLSGLLLPLLFGAYFLFSWQQTNNTILAARAEYAAQEVPYLPEWVVLSQNWPDTWVGQKIMESELTNDQSFDFGLWGGGARNNSFGDKIEHDPLVSIACNFFKSVDVSAEQRIKILESQYDSRHDSHRKLWSGKHLETSSVTTTIDAFPEYRLAYVERTITIKNINQNKWSRPEEALYTFHLPEGSVATSLSLWIEGIEQPSRLTTKGKADSAYVEIVGVEQRDPAILHWQEGNTVTVTIFPCGVKEDRKFKIGFTIPLTEKGEKLVLKNIFFEGPPSSLAQEITNIQFTSQKSMNGGGGDGFESIGKGKFQKIGTYDSYWEMEVNKPPINQDPFVFNGVSYTIEETKKREVEFRVDKIYLDVNAQWTSAEIETVLQHCKDKEVYVYENELHQIDHHIQQLLLCCSKSDLACSL
ncbi:MAG: XrtN system VIT domain-containing protein [Flavobacteriales bacterium]|nr:XrtN system VIT domain-containing protein [Flavobacteriales bacterium]